MSTMQPKGIDIELGGKTYNIRCTLNEIDEIQDHFYPDDEEHGFLDVVQTLYETKSRRKLYKAVRYILFVMVNNSIRRVNRNNGEHTRQFEEWEIGDMIDYSNVDDYAAILTILISSTMPAVEDTDNQSPRDEQN